MSDTTGHDPQALSDDAFLGGALRVLQPRKGFRSGLDAVLLAASVPLRAGERALEAGPGAGAASLCLAWRVGGADVTGLEADGAMAALARENARRNGFADRVTMMEGTLEAPPAALRGAPFDHAFANPPFLEAGEGVAAAGAARGAARMGPAGALALWADFCLRRVKPGGTVTFIHRADRLARLLTLLDGRAGALKIFPVWPRAGAPAKRVLVQAVKESRAPLALLAGLTLHEESGAYAQEAQAVLRHGAPLAGLARDP